MTDDICIDGRLTIPAEDVEIRAVRARGAGGQSVNKLATAVHLRFDYANCSALPQRLRTRIAELDDSRVTSQGIVIKAQEYRSQARNRQAAVERLCDIIRDAAAEKPRRIATRPPDSSSRKRIAEKRRRGRLKQSRGAVDED